MIGVAISTCNRREMLLDTIQHWKDMLPNGAVLVVVDDASDQPVPDIAGVDTIRLPYRLGVAGTKNACITALIDRDCEHLFIADDDVFPIHSDWWKPYVDSPEPHLSYQWERPNHSNWTKIHDDGHHWAIDFPRGVLLYFHRTVFNQVGGFDVAHGKWGGEHVELAQRIYDAGLTRWAFADICGSNRLWYAHDEHNGNTTNSTYPLRERVKLAHPTMGNPALQWQKPRPRYVPYRAGEGAQDYSKGPHLDPYAGHYTLLRHTVNICPPGGVALEFGVGKGESTQILAKRFRTFGFDSGQGIPEDWRPEYPKGSFKSPLPSIFGATMVEGWYEDTLPTFDFAPLGHISIVHIDCDLYSSTKTVLDHVGPHLAHGTFLVFDEMWDYPGHEQHELKAWREFADTTGIGWTVVGHSLEAWCIRIV